MLGITGANESADEVARLYMLSALAALPDPFARDAWIFEECPCCLNCVV
jgi:hypothetical protein